MLDPSAAEFRRRRQPKPTRAAAEQNAARRRASHIFCTPPPPNILWRAEKNVVMGRSISQKKRRQAYYNKISNEPCK